MQWGEWDALDLEHECLPAMLRQLGYATSVFTGAAMEGPPDRKPLRVLLCASCRS